MDDTIKIMINEAREALQNAYAPYSGFAVAACICSENDVLYTGVNVENSSYSLTICAEACAISQMVSIGELKIKKMVLLSSEDALCSPCGGCRQRIFEFSTKDTIIHMCNKEKVLKSLTIDELLPLAFHL